MIKRYQMRVGSWLLNLIEGVENPEGEWCKYEDAKELDKRADECDVRKNYWKSKSHELEEKLKVARECMETVLVRARNYEFPADDIRTIRYWIEEALEITRRILFLKIWF